MPAVNDIIRITYCGNYFSQEVCNVMYYLVSAWTGNLTSQQALEAISDDWFNKLSEVQSDQFDWVSSRMDNITNPADFAEYVPTVPVSGVDTNEPLPPYVSLSLRQNRQSGVTRNGYKRIAGLTNAALDGASWTGTFLSQLDNFGVTQLMVDAFNDANFQAFPVIVGRDASGAPDLGRVNFPATVTKQPNATTQNTRKIGRGV